MRKERQFIEALLRAGGIATKRKEDGKRYVGVGQTAIAKTYHQLPREVKLI